MTRHLILSIPSTHTALRLVNDSHIIFIVKGLISFCSTVKTRK